MNLRERIWESGEVVSVELNAPRSFGPKPQKTGEEGGVAQRGVKGSGRNFKLEVLFQGKKLVFGDDVKRLIQLGYPSISEEGWNNILKTKPERIMLEQIGPITWKVVAKDIQEWIQRAKALRQGQGFKKKTS